MSLIKSAAVTSVAEPNLVDSAPVISVAEPGSAPVPVYKGIEHTKM